MQQGEPVVTEVMGHNVLPHTQLLPHSNGGPPVWMGGKKKVNNTIYIKYTHNICDNLSIHTLPIRMKKHAAIRLIQRFDLDIVELRHVIKTARVVKRPVKEGDIGVLERRMGKGHIRIKYKVHSGVLWIITVEGGHGR